MDKDALNAIRGDSLAIIPERASLFPTIKETRTSL